MSAPRPDPLEEYTNPNRNETAPASGSFLLETTTAAEPEWAKADKARIKHMLSGKFDQEPPEERLKYRQTLETMTTAQLGRSLSSDEQLRFNQLFENADLFLDEQLFEERGLNSETLDLIMEYADKLRAQGNVYILFLQNQVKDGFRYTPQVLRHFTIMAALAEREQNHTS